jgi:TRAP-type C4-dicarboxylate transport system substrate-binding protein
MTRTSLGRRSLLAATFAALAALFLTSAASAQEVKIKLGTVAPQGSTWHELLKDMAAQWKEASGGKVDLKIYAGGTQGNEGEMVKKLAIGQLHAASITVVGLRDITPEPQAIGCPGVLDTEEEYDYVISKMRGELEKVILAKGYVVLNWAEAGFVKIFSKTSRTKVAEYQKGKMFAWNGDPDAEEAWKKAGFRPVLLASTDLIPSLQTNMVDIVTEPPLYAYTSGFYEKAKYMLDLNWGFLNGATVVKRDQWEKIPADLRPKLLAIAEATGAKVQAEVRTKVQESLNQMKAKGLVVLQPENPAEWKNALAQVQSVVRGKVVSAATFDRVIALRDEFRAAKAAGTTPGAATPAPAPAPAPEATPAPAPAGPAAAEGVKGAGSAAHKKGAGSKHKKAAGSGE